ncbi:hypothetical protein PMSD_01865 [Paenibacillus macquariensis subsp. defensor]|nr:hypothetical protein PMSD_01865 [Paenibacillus macquariensis subsp. defensor]
MSDSREVLESKPSPVIPMFIILVFVLLMSALTWSFFGEMDTVAKANGAVRPNEKVSTIQVAEMGKVEKANYVEGMQVKAGELLLVLDQQELITEMDNRQSDLRDAEDELSYLYKHKESVEKFDNLFSPDIPEERSYYDQVEQYLLDYSRQSIEFHSSKLLVEQNINEINQSKESIQMNIGINEQETNQKKKQYETQKKVLEDKVTLITIELENVNLLKQAIEVDENIIQNADSQRVAEFRNYQQKMKQLKIQESGVKKQYERSLQLGDRFVSGVQLEEERKKYEAAQQQIETYQTEILLSVQSTMNEFELELLEVQSNLNVLIDSQVTSHQQETLKLQDGQLTAQEKDLQKQGDTMNELENTTLEKFKADNTVLINIKIEELKNKRDDISEKIEQIQLAQDKRNITAPISGTVNVVKDLNVGDSVQVGDKLFSIIPTNESKYKMNIAVPNYEVGKISVGDQVKFNFSAFPKQSYGSVAGTVTSIGSDSIVQQDGMSYYMVEASLANEPLINRKKEQGEIRVGMTAEAYVITDSQKIIYYVLEKINLKE